MNPITSIPVGGLLTLLAVGFVTAVLVAVASIAWEALHPRRRTLAWALATGAPVDPEALGRAPSTWRLRMERRPAGLVLPAWELDGDAPDGPVTIIVHGWGRSRWDSLRRAPSFLPVSSMVVLPDLRGHGEAEGSTRLGAVESADVVALVEHVVSDRPPGTPIVLVGHSMGAGIVIRATAELAARRAASSASASTLPPPGASDEAPPARGANVVGVIALAPYEYVTTPIAARLSQRALPSAPFASLAVLALRLFGVRERVLSATAARLDRPLLVVTAQDDAISPAADGRRIAEAVPGARGRFTALAGDDHADPGARDPAALDRMLREFVALARTSSANVNHGTPTGNVTSVRSAADEAG